jgi:cytochrome c biogenesis protein CcmG/thiol:disulfide interchange protein DsbE
MRYLAYGFPLAVLLTVLTLIAVPLLRGDDLHHLPPGLINQPVPDFRLPPLLGRKEGLSKTDLVGRVVLVNFFSSWCMPCLAEHPVLIRLSREQGVPVLGINFNDQPRAIESWLERNGDPFERIGVDSDGRVAIAWGVTGVPETFVIDQDGLIRLHSQGPLTPRLVNDEILPLIADLRKR